MTSRARSLALAAVSVVLAASGALAQGLPPNVAWRTIRTEHFHVHFTRELEDQARRAAANAERAYTLLAAELRPPRPPIDLVITDNVDFANGYAMSAPSNRIVIYAHPPVGTSSLRFYDEWNALVVTHELTHIFQFDRARGWWRVAQAVFGRNPAIMPHLYTPSWITEGLAVYYESRLTGSGRLVGTEHGMLARATIADHFGPRLDELSLASSEYPGGQVSYAYGSLLFDHLARTRGPEHVGEFIERVSAAPIPFFLNRAARRSFGVSFSTAWREFRDSVARDARIAGAPMPGWRDLTTDGWDVLFPRWRADSTILYTAITGRDVTGLYSVDLDGRRRRLGRRNSLEPNVQRPDGSLLFAQPDFIDPYHVRSDLYTSDADGRNERRLTKGARLSHPDSRADGAIVAVQAVPASTRLVRVSADGREIVPLTTTAADTHWAEPRWSPDGRRIVAVRRARDGFSEIVVLDTAGGVVHRITRSRSVDGSPSWSSDGDVIYFTSDRTGTAELYSAPSELADNGAASVTRLSDAGTGIFQPEAAIGAPSLAAILFRADGYHVGVAPLPPAGVAAGDTLAGRYAEPRSSSARPPLPPEVRDTSPAFPYSPWRTLVPRYWLPTFGEEDDGTNAFGALTGSGDVVGRHSYAAALRIAPASRDLAGDLVYRWAGLGSPLLGLAAAQFSDYDPVFLITGNDTTFAWLRERTQSLALTATLRRPRVRTASSVTLGVDVERETFSSRPSAEVVRRELPPRDYAGVQLGGGWANVRRPALSISPEDGFSLSGAARNRWRRDGGAPTRLATGTLRAFKSIDLPGFAHHVLAAKLSGGWANDASTSDFEIGGTSGSAVEIFPGVVVGDSPRTFSIRGFPSGIQTGLRAAGATVEFRSPVALPTRGIGFLPFFFDKLSLSLFADAGAAWCGAGTENPGCTGVPTEPEWLASVGGELNLDAAIPYDAMYRFRLGVAAPIRGRDLAGVDPVSVYFSIGVPF